MSDLLEEYQALDQFIRKLNPEDFCKITPGTNRTVYDQLSHIAYFDKVSLLAIEDPAAFADLAKELSALFGKMEMTEIVDKFLAIRDPEALLKEWPAWYQRLADHLSNLPEKDRLPWFGPDMSVKSFATARLAQTWAHGQDIYDALGETRQNGDRIKNIAHLGVITFNWSFTNRDMRPPASKVRVELTAPSGAKWVWNDGESAQAITGSAVDFCLVVTQRRHIQDTRLKVIGDAAKLWMENCQCFAGPPLRGPEKGVRLKNYQ